MANWEKGLTEAEKLELERARKARCASADVLRELTKKLKARAYMRIKRAKNDKAN